LSYLLSALSYFFSAFSRAGHRAATIWPTLRPALLIVKKIQVPGSKPDCQNISFELSAFSFELFTISFELFTISLELFAFSFQLFPISYALIKETNMLQIKFFMNLPNGKP